MLLYKGKNGGGQNGTMEPNSKMDNLLEQLNDELIQMQITDDYCETDNVKWLFNHIGEQLVIMGITKKSEAYSPLLRQ